MNEIKKDLVVIGAGPGGYEVAIEAALKGLNVALIEKEDVGGTCLNHGCIPTKALYKNAEVLHEVKKSNMFGINISNYDFDFNIVLERKNNIIEQLRKNIISMLKKTNVELIYGTASFVDEHSIKVNDILITASNFIISTGSSEKIIPIKGIDSNNVITSKELLNIDSVPKHLVVVGGGVIGVEMACIFKEFGSEVVILEFLDKILANFDSDISSRLKVYLKKLGIEVKTDTLVKEILETNEGLMVLAETKKSKELNFTTDYVLISTGRKAYFDNLNLSQININYDKSGIIVNDNYQTNIPHIYAVGDVIGKMMLAHSATFQSFAALDHILGKDNKTNFNITPACVFTFPEIASVGLTENEAKDLYDDIKINKYMFRANGKALTMSETEGFIKVISYNNKLIGTHIIGPHASSIIHEATVLIEKNITIDEATSIIHAHPTLSETLLEALRGL